MGLIQRHRFRITVSRADRPLGNAKANGKTSYKGAFAIPELPKTYDGLLRMHMLRPLHDRADLSNALEILEAMAGHRLNREQEDYFEALSILVEAYERSFVPRTPRRISGLELVRHLLEASNLNAADLARILGRDRSLGVRILKGDRGLTLDHFIKLSDHFGLPVEAFLP